MHIKARSTASPKPSKRYGVASTLSGYEVVDLRDGRSVSRTMGESEAGWEADSMNESWLNGMDPIVAEFAALEDEVA